MFLQRPSAVPLFHQNLAEIPWHVLKHSVINQILFVQNHFQDCPQYPLSCEKCGKENIPRNEVSSVLLERWHTLSELHLSGRHETELFACTDWLACRRKVKSFIIFWCSKKYWELSGLGYVIIIVVVGIMIMITMMMMMMIIIIIIH